MSSDAFSFAADFPPVRLQDWRRLVDHALKGRDFDTVMRQKSYNDFDIKALYTEADQSAAHQSTAHKSTGPQPVSQQQGWSLCTAHWNKDAKATNTAIKDDLIHGAGSIGLRFQAGHFPGLLYTDLDQILDGIYLDMIDLNLLPGEVFMETAAAFNAYLLRSKTYDGSPLDPTKITGCYGCDPIGVLAQTGRLAQTVITALDASAAIAHEACSQAVNMRAFSVNTTMYHCAGATEAQELGLMLSTALEYLKAMENQGLALSDAVNQIQFNLAADANIYLSMAKFRAARRLWAELLVHCGMDAAPMKLTAIGSFRMMTMKDPWVNILRSTAACFAAGVAGADEITLIPHDSMLGLSSDFARRIVRNIHVILQEESTLGQVIDPAAGSYAIEALTTEMTQKAWEEFQHIEKTGGIISGLSIGSVQAALEDSWQKRRKNIATRKDVVTGVSEFPNIHEDPLTDVGPQPSYILDTVEPAIEISPVAFHRAAEDFESLRVLSDQYLTNTGKRPTVLLVTLGPVSAHTARATFAKNFFESGGIETTSAPSFDTAEDLSNACRHSEADGAVLCGSDDAYDLYAAEIITVFKDAGLQHIYLAGKPDYKQTLASKGLTDCIYRGANVLEILTNAITSMTLTGEVDND